MLHARGFMLGTALGKTTNWRIWWLTKECGISK